MKQIQTVTRCSSKSASAKAEISIKECWSACNIDWEKVYSELSVSMHKLDLCFALFQTSCFTIILWFGSWGVAVASPCAIGSELDAIASQASKQCSITTCRCKTITSQRLARFQIKFIKVVASLSFIFIDLQHKVALHFGCTAPWKTWHDFELDVRL